MDKVKKATSDPRTASRNVNGRIPEERSNSRSMQLQPDRTRLPRAQEVNKCWRLDVVVAEYPDSEQRVNCLIVVDEFTYEFEIIPIGSVVDGDCIVRLLEGLGKQRGFPETVLTDCGQEFAERAFTDWALRRGLCRRVLSASRHDAHYSMHLSAALIDFQSTTTRRSQS